MKIEKQKPKTTVKARTPSQKKQSRMYNHATTCKRCSKNGDITDTVKDVAKTGLAVIGTAALFGAIGEMLDND